MLRRLLPALAAVALTACGGSSDPAAAPAETSPPSVSPAATSPTSNASGNPVGAVPAALEFTAPLLGGGEIEMGALAGRPVLLWFWAPW